MGRKAPRKRLTCRVMACPTGVLSAAPERLSALRPPSFGVSEATMQNPGAKTRRGNEEVCVLAIVRPGMEDSESAEKQENTGIRPASRGPGRGAARNEGEP